MPGETQARCLLLQLTAHRTVADENESAVIGQLGQRVHQDIQSFVRLDAPDEANDEGFASSAGLARPCALVDFGVEAELRNDMDGASIALALQDVRCLAIARDGCPGVAIIVQFHLPERRRVVAIEILPGEEEGAGALPVCEAYGLKGGKVVRLLVDMHHVRSRLAHDRRQPRVVVQVKIAVQAHGRYDHTIAVGVKAL